MKDIETQNLRLVLRGVAPADEQKGYVPQYFFDMRLKREQKRIGHINLRVGNNTILHEYSGHISYGVDESYRGHRFASEACKAILPVAVSLGIHPIRITCDPDNIASRRTCELAGGRYLGDVDVPPGNYVYETGGRRKCRFEFAAGEDGQGHEMITIRKFQWADARAVATLISETYSEFCRVEGSHDAVQGYVDYYNPRGKSDPEVEQLFSRTPIHLVAISGSRIVGVLRAADNRITNLFVHRDYHRRGIATKLVNRFETICRAAGRSEVVLRGSLYAIPFYEAIGYKKTTGIRNFRGLMIQPMKKKFTFNAAKEDDGSN